MGISDTIASAVRVEIQQPPLLEVPGPQQQQPSELTPEQLRAVESVFSAADQESQLVLGLLGMWTGTLVLHDVLKETVTPASDEELEKLKKRKPNLNPESDT